METEKTSGYYNVKAQFFAASVKRVGWAEIPSDDMDFVDQVVYWSQRAGVKRPIVRFLHEKIYVVDWKREADFLSTFLS